jgi:hypothetical protein
MKNILSVLAIVVITAVSACGGNSGGGSTTSPPATSPTDTLPPAQPTKAVLKLSTSNTTTDIAGLDVTIALPDGVIVKSTTNPPETDAGIVVASGQAAANSLVEATYTATSGTSPAKVRVALVNTYGFGPGEFATITCDLVANAHPASSDFSVLSATAWDPSTNLIAGVNVKPTVTLK